MAEPRMSFIDYFFNDGLFNWFWLFVVAALAVCTILFYMRAREFKAEGQTSSAALFNGYALFFGCTIITRFAFFVSNYYSLYGGATYYDGETLPEFIVAIRIAYCTSLVALAFLFYGLEKYILPTKFIATLIPLVVGILALILPYDTARMINTAIMPLYFLFGVGSYVYIFKHSTGELRKNSLITMVGLLLFFMGLLLDSKFMKVPALESGVIWPAYILPPIIATIGIILFTYSATRKHEE